MNEQNLARHANSRWIDFWHSLQPAYMALEATGQPAMLDIFDGRVAENTAGPTANDAMKMPGTTENTEYTE
jgi:murein L,D-transpeptidase YafK